MNMQTILLTDFDLISQIYELHMKKDFPASELKPLAIIRKAWDRGNYNCYGMFDGPELVGYAFFVKLPDGEGSRYLFDYFAIADSCRDRGYGSEMLKQLSEQIRDAACIVGEVEDPDKAADDRERQIRERRLSFYLRNGFLETGVTVRTFGVDYRILEIDRGQRHSKEEIRNAYADLYRNVLPALMFKAFIRIM